jgi:hypothetical protein
MSQKNLTHKIPETYARLTAPQHITISHFSRHQKIEGYLEYRDVPEFLGSDRLWRLDTVYGSIQLGYNPRKGQSFLFANIKTSILDTAASRHQKELKEYQMMRALKSESANIAYTSKRRGGSAVLLYNMEPQPWSRRAVMPYLRRANMEALQKTMPFLDRSAELSRRAEISKEQRSLQDGLAAHMRGRRYGEMSLIRAKQTALSAHENELNALIYRKDTQQSLFFRKLNYAMNLQKREMFAYYRDRRKAGGVMSNAAAPVENTPIEVKDE